MSQEEIKLKIDNQRGIFSINPKIYPLTAIYQTAYLFLDDYYIFLSGEPETLIEVTMQAKDAAKPVTEAIYGQFYNELLNQLLRCQVSETNAKIREYIVAQALYNALPKEVDELLKEVEADDWQKDPLGIAKPWSGPATATSKEE